MEPTALNSANTDYEGLELVVEWLKAHSDSRNDHLTFEGTPPALNDTGYAGPEDDELANPIVASPPQRHPADINLDPNGRFICRNEGCDQTFGSTKVLYRHEAKHNPAAFHCEQCNYSTWRKDKLQSHHNRWHKRYTGTDRLKCQNCNYETYHKDDLRKHQGRRHVKDELANEILPDAGTEVSITAPVVASWLQPSFDSRNEDDELANKDDCTNEIPPDVGTEVIVTVPVAAAASPRRQRRPNTTNGYFICTHEGCGKTFACTQVLRRHMEKHNPAVFQCEQCNYSTYRKDMLQDHHDRRHKHNMDFLECQKCNYKTYHKNDLRRHQGRHELNR